MKYYLIENQLFIIKIVIIFRMETNLANLKAEDEKLSLAFCKKILNVNGNSYSDEEVLRIRNYLYQLAEIECRHFKDWQAAQENKIIAINRNDYETTKSYSIHQSEYRRAG
jgi:hypothetical protein